MTREEAIRFMRGEGCPTCKFGREIPKWKNEEH
jgi:Zn ribbon nucleic-acid-binding protein